MKLWLDDVREPLNKGWNWVKTGEEAIELLKQGAVDSISLDHDLGEEGLSGYDVAKWIEEMAAHEGLDSMTWRVHSANPVGKKNIEAAMRAADKFWHASGSDEEEDEGVRKQGRDEWR